MIIIIILIVIIIFIIVIVIIIIISMLMLELSHISLFRVSGVEPLSGDYCALSSDHTLCKYPVSVSIVDHQACTKLSLSQGPSDSCSAKTIYRELSEEAKQAILDKHNDLRGRVARGEETGGINGPQPAGANMRKLVSGQRVIDK